MSKELFKELLECPVSRKTLEFAKKFIENVDPTEKQEFLDFASESDDTFVKMINCVGYFTRDSQSFQILTSVHTWGMKNDPDYKMTYQKISNGDREDIIDQQETFNPDEFLGEL